MGFNGDPVVTTVSNNIQHIIGGQSAAEQLKLAAGATGNIAVAGVTLGTGDINLNANFKPAPYGNVSVIQACEVNVIPTGGVGPNPFRYSVTKVLAVPSDPKSLAIAIENLDQTNETPALEIYVRFHT